VPVPGLLSILGLVLWAGYELVLRRRADTDTGSWQGGSQDRGSTRLLIAAYAAALAVNVVLSAVSAGPVPVVLRWVGVGVLAIGLAVRAWGMTTLGAAYTRTLRTTGGQRLVESGPYRLVRHPGYSGSLLVWTGYSLGLGSWLALIVTAGLLLGVYSWRIAAEERMLLSTFGEEYAEYRRHTKRLLPFLY
jgi:protein-S-isoprenylcysteine O-methyltransferase